ncbi:hypothetical protein BH23ACT9_BH23ACT9_35470 [soil metagenome]
MRTTTTAAAQYRTLAERFARVAGRLDPAAWDRPSPCEGWTARDVVAHVIGTQRDFLQQQGIALDGPAEPMTDPAAAWDAHSAAMAACLDQSGVAETPYEGMFGPSTVGETLLTFYGFDMVVHRWDVAAAAGRSDLFDGEEMDRLEGNIAAFGEHLYMEGICGPAVEVPGDAPRQDRLLATLGRAPR